MHRVSSADVARGLSFRLRCKKPCSGGGSYRMSTPGKQDTYTFPLKACKTAATQQSFRTEGLSFEAPLFYGESSCVWLFFCCSSCALCRHADRRHREEGEHAEDVRPIPCKMGRYRTCYAHSSKVWSFLGPGPHCKAALFSRVPQQGPEFSELTIKKKDPTTLLITSNSGHVQARA